MLLVVIHCTTRCHSLSLVVIHCHSLSFVVTGCHSLPFVVSLSVTRFTNRCHSLSFIVIRFTTRCHSLNYSLSLAVIHGHSMYHSLSFYEQSIIIIVLISCNQMVLICLEEFFPSLVLAGRLATRLSFCKILRFSWYFLISLISNVLSRLATHEVTRNM